MSNSIAKNSGTSSPGNIILAAIWTALSLLLISAVTFSVVSGDVFELRSQAKGTTGGRSIKQGGSAGAQPGSGGSLKSGNAAGKSSTGQSGSGFGSLGSKSTKNKGSAGGSAR